LTRLQRYKRSTFILLITLFVPLMAIADVASPLPNHFIKISFDLPNHLIIGSVDITLPSKVKSIVVGRHLEITELLLNGELFSPEVKGGLINLPPHPDGTKLSINYKGLFDTPEDEFSDNRIDKDGATLLEDWYPAAQADLSHFSLEAKTPRGLVAVSEADKIVVEQTDQGSRVFFEFPHPVSNIHLAMGPYIVERDRYRDIEITTCFLPKNRSLAARYLDRTKKYLQMYEELLGPYPYRRFSIVESTRPVGYGMPTFTLLGENVIRLPFIPETSLGHEILHSWFGNSVYVDHATGNWSEGLTFYLADNYYEDLKGKGWGYRKRILEYYESYIFEKTEVPVVNFKSGQDGPLRAVGYGKVAMIFHMLKNYIGEDSFMNALRILVARRLFQTTSWMDIEEIFSEASGEDLKDFFTFWTHKKGALDIYADQIRTGNDSQGYILEFRLNSTGLHHPLRVPVSIRTDEKTEKRTFKMSESRQSFTISLDGIPREVIIDPNYNLFRTLSLDEKSPVLSRLLGDHTRTVVIPKNGGETYNGLVRQLEERGFERIKEKDLSNITLDKRSLLFLGPQKDHGFFPGSMEGAAKGFLLRIKFNPSNPGHVVGLVLAENEREASAAAGKIFHYGNYSYLSFSNGVNLEKIKIESDRGGRFAVPLPVSGISINALQALPRIISGVADKAIVYVGEKHDRYGDHIVQLEVIKGLYKQHKKLAIGMEMFQYSYQNAIDDYIYGRIDEQTFLLESHYFSTWKFNYHLYRDILRFARDQRIPVIALNMDNKIVRKVAQKGLESISKQEKLLLPENMDFSDQRYKESLKTIFKTHQDLYNDMGTPTVFENFFHAQVLWDETMAENVQRFLAKNPDYNMVILAGNGHLVYDFGIPKRAFKKTGRDYAVIMPDPQIPLEPNLADFIVFPNHIEAPVSPMLMVKLDVEKTPLKVVGFPSESGAEEAGMKKGDEILSIDNQVVKDIETLRALLFFKKVGDRVRVKILRGKKEMELSVVLKSPSKGGPHREGR